MANEKRLMMLEQITQAGQADSFAWYGLALEYKSFERIDDALKTFTTLRQNDPAYVPMYLMCGTMLVEAARVAEGREWLETGLDKANAAGNSHAASELQEALNQLAD